ncbi:uncharacterized protein LOC128671945 isoform X2 [Plodia interpunctella]|uniref:uncharacterized protein LOC128671945 isoform X2 n=1 Tax=Plodia interpunctella TaxID=58824 RepID=UPI002367DFE7|nr:uncharacterized protein LOC128671945 isoform X2 [Plodia interpunctella]
MDSSTFIGFTIKSSVVIIKRLAMQVMASRESLIESHHDECESDDTILMSQEFGSTALDFVEDDPLTLKEVHEHMIRSPPPITSWPHDSLSYRAASAFDFDSSMYSAYSTDDQELLGSKSPRPERPERSTRPRSSRSVSPRSHDLSLSARPLSLPGETHLRNALSNKKQSMQTERFSLLQHPRPLRRPHSNRRDDDSVQLVQDCDK